MEPANEPELADGPDHSNEPELANEPRSGS
jgi:hypothetical protein